MTRRLILIFTIFLPNSFKIFIYKKFFKWDIGKGAKIGFSYIDTGTLKLGSGCVIKHLSVIKGLNCLDMSYMSRIGNLNWISTSVGNYRGGGLFMGEHSALTNRHYLDCTASISIGDFSTVAGVKSTLMTHSINVYESRQGAEEIIIGSYCFIGTCCTFLGGASVSDKVIIAANSTVPARKQTKPKHIYGGTPIKELKYIGNVEVKYFERNEGVVH